MSKNPYLARPAYVGRNGDALTDGGHKAGRTTRAGTVIQSNTESAVAGNGEINAGSKRELMQAISSLQRAVAVGDVRQASAQEQYGDVVSARRELVEAAYADKNGEGWQVLGEVIGEEIWETLGREGFARKTLLIKPLGKGETGRLRVRRKDVISFFATSDPNVIASSVRQYYIYPPEFYMIAHITIEDKEIEQASGDLLDDKYQDGLEQIMVNEDNVWRNLVNAAAGASNDLFLFNTFTPTVFSTMRTQIARWGIPVTGAVIAFDLWDDIIADTEFSTWFDPVSKHEIVLEGSLGSILGVNLITDAFRHDTLQVLQPGEVYFVGAPQTLGGITQRKELATESINKYNQGKPERGWFMETIEGMSIVNSRAVTRGNRV
jgi:hypothetical protein